MNRCTFLDSSNQASFEKNGYILVNGFLNAAEIELLREFYFSEKPDMKHGFHASMHSKNPAYRRKVNEKISSVFTPKAQRILDNYRPLVANYTVKESGQDSFFDFHLDWNMVDEKKCKSITIWTPLEDTNENNGYFMILEKSHTLGESYRCGPGLRMYYEDLEELKQRKFVKKPLYMKAGDAIIYDHKLYHGSLANNTCSPRLAINQAMLPREVKSVHYLADEFGNIKQTEVDDDYYCRCIINEIREKNTVVDEFRIESNPVSQTTVNNMILN